MTVKSTVKSSWTEVQAILNNELVTLSVSHEEVWEPDERDGDFAEPTEWLICAMPGSGTEPLGLIDGEGPELYIIKSTVLPVLKA
jgi:hypothetical protein